MKTIDVGAILDEGQWSAYQKFLVFVTALAIILDGLDNQVLGSAIPALMREWSVPRPAFVPVQTSGMVGMMIGGFIGGYLGDRMGRRVALIGSVVAFGVLTVLVSLQAASGPLASSDFSPGSALVVRCPMPPRCRPNTFHAGSGRSR